MFLELVLKRQSDRGYVDTPVEEEKIRRCVEAVRLAPSACNAQPWKIVIVDDSGLKEQVAAQTTTGPLPLNHFTRQAPLLAVLIMEQGSAASRFGSAVKGKHFPLIDAGIAAEHFCLQAAEEGLGTCMIGWFNEEGVRRILGIPRKVRPVLIITLGYPSNPATREKRRKSPDEISCRNRYE